MSEPINPLFEEEKAFLERKKLEYERALRGDIAVLKQQTADAGRVALVGAGLAGSIWLITKAFSSKKRRPSVEDHEYDEASDYPTQHFGDYDYYDEDDRRHAPARWHNEVDTEVNDYFAEQPADAYADFDEDMPTGGTVYHTDTDHYDTPDAPAHDTTGSDVHGFADHGDFDAAGGAYGSSGHPEAAMHAEHFQTEAYGHPDSSLPFDDSRRLPESEDFTLPTATEQHDDAFGNQPIVNLFRPEPAAPKQSLGAMLIGLARTDLGKVVVGQAASLAIALATKAIKAKLLGDESETQKTSDLAGSTDSADGYAHGHPATPQPDAHHPAAEATNF